MEKSANFTYNWDVSYRDVKAYLRTASCCELITSNAAIFVNNFAFVFVIRHCLIESCCS